MGKVPKPCKKGGYCGDQRQVLRFRASDRLYVKLQDLAQKKGLCLAAVVRKLVIAGLEKSNN